MATEKPVAFITGANSGIGFSIAHRLLTQVGRGSLTVILGCRNAKRAETAQRQLLEEFPQADLHTLTIDTSDTQSVRTAAQELQRRFNRLDFLFCNAGIMAPRSINYLRAAYYFLTDPRYFVTSTTAVNQGRGLVTSEGLGLVFATNLFGHYLLIHQLTSFLKQSPNGCRIIWTSSRVSSGQSNSKEFDVQDYQHIKGAFPYESSKLLVDLVSNYLNERYLGTGIVSYTTEPGIAITNIHAEVGNLFISLAFMVIAYTMRLLGVNDITATTFNGALAMVHVATTPPKQLDIRHKYCSRCTPLAQPYVMEIPMVYDRELAKEIVEKLDALVQQYSAPIESPQEGTDTDGSGYTQFEAVHRNQLIDIDFPPALWQRLYAKLAGEVFDAGNAFVLEEQDNEELSPYRLVAKSTGLTKHSDVYLIDHAWATTTNDPYHQLLMDPNLLVRLAKIVHVDIENNDSGDDDDDDIIPDDISADEWDRMVTLVAKEGLVEPSQAKRILKEENFELVNAIMAAKGLHDAASDNNILDQIKEHIVGQISVNQDSGSTTMAATWATPNYTCHQYQGSDDSEGFVDIVVVVGPHVDRKSIKCNIQRNHLQLTVGDLPPVIDGDLYDNIDVEESTWELDHDKVVITLKKAHGDKPWPKLVQGESQVDIPCNTETVHLIAAKIKALLQTYKYVQPLDNGETRQVVIYYVMDEVGCAIQDSQSPNVLSVHLALCGQSKILNLGKLLRETSEQRVPNIDT
ncbi:3-keto-steroid reductase [Dispira parvispora]|uniref:3-keto-steroid reductase n=1 Tax=Dispira parvispora TaxID=1520584 RepID=A0A9W8AQH6_9FUNG|nr:3-keto-steroid reductase [Dispira parvispora]